MLTVITLRSSASNLILFRMEFPLSREAHQKLAEHALSPELWISRKLMLMLEGRFKLVKRMLFLIHNSQTKRKRSYSAESRSTQTTYSWKLTKSIRMIIIGPSCSATKPPNQRTRFSGKSNSIRISRLKCQNSSEKREKSYLIRGKRSKPKKLPEKIRRPKPIKRSSRGRSWGAMIRTPWPLAAISALWTN